MFGSCFHSDGKSVLPEKIKTNWNPRPSDHGKNETTTQLLMADIDMLRKGSFLMGAILSNLVRMVHYLRYPHFEDTYTMLPRFADVERQQYFF